jgi:hypothetical protein
MPQEEEIKLDPRIQNSGNLATEAFSYLKKIQTGEKPIFKTGQDFIDCHIGGLLPSDVIIISANSGVGKTKLLFDTLDLILDEEVNKNAENIVSLEYSLEMRFLNRVLRDTNKQTGKKKSDILSKEFTEEEKEVVRRYYEGLKDNRRFVVEESITPEEFYEITRNFCKKHKDREAIIVSLDHVLNLKKSGRNEDPLETLTSYINQLRKEFPNVYFILLTQFNRSSFTTIADRNNDMVPRASMIYGSSHFEFLSAYIIAILDPFKMGVTEFMKVNTERYDWLEDYMTDEDKKGKVSFHTVGNMFYFVLKTRESDVPYRNLFIRKMDLTEEQLSKMKSEVQEKEEKHTIQTPVFTNDNIKPNFNLSQAFDTDDKEEDNDAPF